MQRATSRALRTVLIAALSLGAAACTRNPGSEPSDRPRTETPEQPAERVRSEPDPGLLGAQTERAPEAPPTPPPAEPAEPVAATDPALLNPAAANERAPARFVVEMTTTKGPILIEVQRAWSPNGADRFYNLARLGYYTDVAFFRVIGGFMAQAGLHGDPRVNAAWRQAQIPDDAPARQSNTRGMVSFAMAGPNTRTTQFFISFGDNSQLDSMGFTPFGRVRDMGVVDQLHAGYGEGAPRGLGPSQGRVAMQGNAYLRESFPQLDYIQSARIR